MNIVLTENLEPKIKRTGNVISYCNLELSTTYAFISKWWLLFVREEFGPNINVLILCLKTKNKIKCVSFHSNFSNVMRNKVEQTINPLQPCIRQETMLNSKNKHESIVENITF